jgi:tRNA dimethylallyltransferase
MASRKQNNQQHLIVVGGPTASGKTSLAIQIALRYRAEIISADSRQFYREMTIGTAKPSTSELQQVRHHFINSLSVLDDYSVGDFEQQAMDTLGHLFEKHPVVVAVGGSGLFLHALCQGLDAFPPILPAVKEQVKIELEEKGINWLQETVRSLDPKFYAKADIQNPARLRRAVEVCLSSGQPYSSFLGKTSQIRNFQIHYLLPEWDREVLYDRINQRVDLMIAQGLEEEVFHLRPMEHRTALKTVGYEEWIPFFEGKIQREEVIDKIKQHSRNYAKRQLTWFRKYGHWFPMKEGELESAFEVLEKEIQLG